MVIKLEYSKLLAFNILKGFFHNHRKLINNLGFEMVEFTKLLCVHHRFCTSLFTYRGTSMLRELSVTKNYKLW